MKIKVTCDFKGPPNLEDEIANTLAKEIQKEIDSELMVQILLEDGYHKVVLKPLTWEQGDEIDLWTAANIKGRYWTEGLVWMFKDVKDANWFKLRWLGQ